MKLAHIATRVARDLIIFDNPSEATVRDACDLATWQELSPRMLDRLCAMVELRLCDPGKYGLTW